MHPSASTSTSSAEEDVRSRFEVTIPQSDADNVGLIEIEVATLFVLTDSGRILRGNDPERSADPRLYLGGSKSGNIVRFRHDVGEETARAIEALVAHEPPLGEPDSTPLHLDDYVDLLAAESPVERQSAGLTYCVPDRLGYEHDVTLVGSDTPEGDRFLADLAPNDTMPRTLVELGFEAPADIWAPWCIALHRGEVASIGMTARIGPKGAEVGVITVPALRGRGFATAVTAGWASLPSLRGRALFYSTERTNVSSQHVAERLGLRFIGASFQIT